MSEGIHLSMQGEMGLGPGRCTHYPNPPALGGDWALGQLFSWPCLAAPGKSGWCFWEATAKTLQWTSVDQLEKTSLYPLPSRFTLSHSLDFDRCPTLLFINVLTSSGSRMEEQEGMPFTMPNSCWPRVERVCMHARVGSCVCLPDVLIGGA